MKNTERYRHLRVDWVGQSITLCGVEGEDIGAGQALCPDCAQIGPRRQGYASPLRALDRCGSIWRDALFTREKGGCRSASDFISHLISFDSIAPRHKPGHSGRACRAERFLSAIPAALSRSRGALSPAGP